MTIKELADAMKLQPSVIIKNLFMKGKMVKAGGNWIKSPISARYST